MELTWGLLERLGWQMHPDGSVEAPEGEASVARLGGLPGIMGVGWVPPPPSALCVNCRVRAGQLCCIRVFQHIHGVVCGSG